MLTSNAQPLSVASQVLSRETISQVRRQPFHARGWRILDRWATQDPAGLRRLEGQGLVVFLNRVLNQQAIEHEALMAALVAGDAHLAELEVLEQAGIATGL